VGCTDSNAYNYLASAQQDSGTCTFPTYGCTFATALNYDSSADILQVPRAFEPSHCRSLADSNCPISVQNCIFPITGCLDSGAVNFNAAVHRNWALNPGLFARLIVSRLSTPCE
jgi:hypothetical protein